MPTAISDDGRLFLPEWHILNCKSNHQTGSLRLIEYFGTLAIYMYLPCMYVVKESACVYTRNCVLVGATSLYAS